MDCHPCKRSVPLAPLGLGMLGSPLGTCHKCYTLACGFHAVRTLRAKFVCVRCELGVLASSAGYQKWACIQPDVGDAGEQAITHQLIGVAGGAVGGPGGPDSIGFWSAGLFVCSLVQWMQDRADYGEEFLSGLRQAVGRLQEQAGHWAPQEFEPPFSPDTVGGFWETSNSDVRDLMAAAVAFVLVLGSSVGEVPPVIAWFAAYLGTRLSDSPTVARGAHSYAEGFFDEQLSGIDLIDWNRMRIDGR